MLRIIQSENNGDYRGIYKDAEKIYIQKKLFL